MESKERTQLVASGDGKIMYGIASDETTPLVGASGGKQKYVTPSVDRNSNNVFFLSQKEEKHLNNSGAKKASVVKSIRIPKPVLNIILSILTVAGTVCLVISIPMLSGALTKGGSDPFIGFLLASMWYPVPYFGMLLFCKFFINSKISLKPAVPWRYVAIVGILNAMNGMLQATTSLPENTPPYLQGILTNMLIPCTVIARLIIIGKGINRKQFVCILILGIGVFIALEPTIFRLDSSSGESNSNGRWYFILLFALSYLPFASVLVFMEKGQKTYGGDSVSFMAWAMLFLCGTYLMCFGVDFIPGFGMASTAQDYIQKLKTGILCFYGAGGQQCSNVPGRAAFFISSFVTATFSNLLLVKFAEGAVYSVVVQAFVTPLVTLFWTLFQESPTFHFQPSFSTYTLYVLSGLVIMMPAVVMYSVFSDEEQEEPASCKTQKVLPTRSKESIKAGNTPDVQDYAHFGNNPS